LKHRQQWLARAAPASSTKQQAPTSSSQVEIFLFSKISLPNARGHIDIHQDRSPTKDYRVGGFRDKGLEFKV